MGWAFWDVKGGFQNAREEDMVKQLEKSEEGRKWIPYVRNFFRAREFDIEWDGKTRGRGKKNIGALQGSPLLLVIFLIWMALILEEMEQEVKEYTVVKVELPSYVDDIYVGLCIWDKIEAKTVDMDLLLTAVDIIINRVTDKHNLPLEKSKHEWLVLRKKRRRKNNEVKMIKWLGIIMDEGLTFREHWRARIQKARSILGRCKGIGNPQWGISPTSWRNLYIGIVRAIALWSAELGWCGQRDWEREFEQLQYQALMKCTGATRGSRKELVSQIAGVESPSMIMNTAQSRLMGKNLRDSTALRDLVKDEEVGVPMALRRIINISKKKTAAQRWSASSVSCVSGQSNCVLSRSACFICVIYWPVHLQP